MRAQAWLKRIECWPLLRPRENFPALISDGCGRVSTARSFFLGGRLWTTTNWRLTKHDEQVSTERLSRKSRGKCKLRLPSVLRKHRRQRPSESVSSLASSAPRLS